MAGKDFYEILGVGRDATAEEIKKAYRGLARKYHPDLHPGDKGMEKKFKEINEAYSVLGDPKKKEDYDLTGRVPGGAGGPGAGWPPGGGGMGGMGGFGGFGGGGGGGFEDIFGEIFGGMGGGRRRGPQRGADLEYRLSLDFLQAVRGTEIKVTVRRQSGASEKITIKIPAGISDGARVRVAGKGDEGSDGGPPGDLFIITTVGKHPYFKRKGKDIYIDVPVTIGEALLGAEIEVPTITGPARIKISPGTQGGRKLRLRGKGVAPRRGAHGNQYCEIHITLPSSIDKRSEELIREFESRNAYDPRKGLW